MSLPLFAAVSCGNNFYRVLTRPWTLLLGHVSYSVYLAHGLLLYFLVQRALGATVVASMTPIRYWGWIVLAVTPLVVLAASLTYRFIEAPFLKRASLSLRPMERKPSVVLSGQT
jgi:peptidoglycan/LPS O-acetylase OafA/YrhL